MAKKYVQINYRPSPGMKSRMDAFVEKTGRSKQELMDTALDLYLNVEPEFWQVIERSASEMRLNVSDVICNMLIKKIAVESAFLETFGRSPKMDEFRIEDGKLLGGDDLLDVLTSEYVEKFQKLKDNLIKTKDAKTDAEKPVVSTDDFREFFACK